MESDLTAILLADSGLTALVKTGTAAARIYWVEAPQGVAKPYVLLQRISGLRDTPMEGPTGFVESRLQVDCYGLTYATTKATAQAVGAALSGLTTTQGTTEFQGFFLDAERDGFEADATPDKLFRTSLDFIVFHKGV